MSWERRSGSFRLSVDVPPETAARIVVPPPDKGQWRAIRVNDALVWEDGALQPNTVGITDTRVEPDGVHLDIDRQGRLAIEARSDLSA